MNCRHCNTKLNLTLVDLGSAPPSNAYITESIIHSPEKWFPLRVLVCEKCWLVQTEDFTQADQLFNADYAYFSGFSSGWIEHSRVYVSNMVDRFNLDENSHVVEVAANDGYLLQHVKNRNIPCIGIEPTFSTASAARDKGIHIIEDFFGERLARELLNEGRQADLAVANNVLAHVPNINDFVSGFKILLKPNGVATFEFPHLLKMINKGQFDTIYHEHFSYLSFTSVNTIFSENGLQIFDIEKHKTHGGSLRIFAQRSDTGIRVISDRVNEMHELETRHGISSVGFYANFQEKANKVKNNLLKFLIQARQDNKKVAAYGAAAKGSTLLNYAGIKPDLLRYVVDKNPSKQGKYMPGSRIPIKTERYLKNDKPDYVVILPWNLKSEVTQQLDYVKQYGGKFVIAVPGLEVI
jgi:ubiquinone/menaquinone biosynthesis C-methylase UbiE